jgi:hypothetical protein
MALSLRMTAIHLTQPILIALLAVGFGAWPAN